MNTYKITNITNLVGKRDPKFNSIANIEYIDNRTKKIISLKPSESVFLTVQSLPLSVHRLRIKKLINILEISPTELKKMMEKAKPKVKILHKSKTAKKSMAKIESVIIEEKETLTPEKKTTIRKKRVKA